VVFEVFILNDQEEMMETSMLAPHETTSWKDPYKEGLIRQEHIMCYISLGKNLKYHITCFINEHT